MRICIILIENNEFFNFFFENRPFNKGGLFIAPRTLLKVKCWGDKQDYSNGKIAFPYICPVEDLGIPHGYKFTKAGKNAAVQGYKELVNRRKTKKIKDDYYNF